MKQLFYKLQRFKNLVKKLNANINKVLSKANVIKKLEKLSNIIEDPKVLQ